MTSKSGPTDHPCYFVRTWTYSQVRAVLPYVASIMGSLREHRLAALRHHLASDRLAAKPGRPGRDTLLALEEAAREARRAEADYQETLTELESLGIRCLNPVAGQALIPFCQGRKVTWYVHDLFEPQPLRFWPTGELGKGQERPD
jgi:hypothetical protein